jgi:hypothetical protein
MEAEAVVWFELNQFFCAFVWDPSSSSKLSARPPRLFFETGAMRHHYVVHFPLIDL